MPKVFGMHEVVLPPGVTPDEYAQSFNKESASSASLPGWKTYLLIEGRCGQASPTTRRRERRGARSVFSQTGGDVRGTPPVR